MKPKRQRLLDRASAVLGIVALLLLTAALLWPPASNGFIVLLAVSLGFIAFLINPALIAGLEMGCREFRKAVRGDDDDDKPRGA